MSDNADDYRIKHEVQQTGFHVRYQCALCKDKASFSPDRTAPEGALARAVYARKRHLQSHGQIGQNGSPERLAPFDVLLIQKPQAYPVQVTVTDSDTQAGQEGIK